MDIKLADGTIVKNVPKGVTPEQVQAKFDARKSRDEGIGGMDLVKSLASGVNRLGSSLAGMADNSIIGDAFRAVDGTPMREQVKPSPFDTPEIAAKKEQLAEEYLKAEPVTKKVQKFFSDNAETWNEEQSAPAKNIRSYVNSGKGFVDTAGRYLKHPSAGVMSAVESLPMMAPLILTKGAPATTQLTIGALHESAANAEDARQGALEDAKKNGATAAQALEASNLARDLAFASTMATMPINAAGGVNALRRVTGRAQTEGAKHGFSQIPKQMLAEAGQEFLQEGSSKVAQNMGAQQTYAPDRNAFEGAAVAGLHGAVAGGIMGGAMGTLAVPQGAAPEAEPTPGNPQPTPQASPDAQAAQARKAELDAIRQQRPLTPEEQEDADVADAILARNAPQQPPAQGGQPAGTPAPQPAPAPQAGAPIVGATPQPAGAPVGSNIPQPPEPQQPAPGLSGVVQRHTQSAAPALDTVFGDAIKGNQVPDFTVLAQQTGLDRNALVDQFNAKRTDHVRKQGLMDLAEQGDLNALRSAVSGITVDPQQQDQLIEEAVAGNEQRKAEALAASQQQDAQAQQQAQQSAQQQADKDKYDQTYGKMLDEAVAALEGGQTEVKTFLPIKKKYSASGLNATDVNGVIEHAKQVIAEKRQKTESHEQAVIEAMPHLQSGDEASAVLAMEQAGVTDDADVQSVLKEANKRIRQDSKKPAGTQSVPVVQPADPLASAVAEVKAAQASGKKVNLATIAKKHGVPILDVAKGATAKPEQEAVPADVGQVAQPVPSQPLALPAPEGVAAPGAVMVSRNGRVMGRAEADALDAVANAEKKQMRRDMAEEAGNPTGIPSGMRPRVETPARTEQKAVLPNLILRTDGKPFPDTKQATRVLASKKLEDTHEVVSVEGGKAIAPKKSVTAKNQVDPEKDDILSAIAKLGGIDRAQAKSQGIDPADFSRRAGGIQFVFRKNGGKELDRMAEALSEMGYPVTENGDYTVNALLDSLDAALRGSAVGTPIFHEARARAEYEARYEEEMAQAAIDAMFDGGSSADTSWLDDSTEPLVESLIDNNAQPSAVMADALNEVENEREITSPAAGAGQEIDTGAEARGGQGRDAQAAGLRGRGQQEGQGGAGQDSGIQAGFSLTAQTEAERLAEEQRQAADLEARHQADEAVRLKAQADKDVSSFTLTGSNRPADVAMAAGQNDLFAPQTRGQKEAAKNQYADKIMEWDQKAAKWGKAKIVESARSGVASNILGRDFAESADSFYAKNPSSRATRDWLYEADGRGVSDELAKIRADQKPAQGDNTPKTEDTISDADYAQVVEAAKYLKDIVYSLDNLLGDDKRLLLSLSSPLGKSGRDTILMDTFGIDRNLAHTIHNRMDDSKPHKLRDIDMTDALDTFPMLKKIIDDVKEELRLRDERKAAKDIFAPQTRGEKAAKAESSTTTEPVKWFGSRDKADAWIAKNGPDYHVVQAGPSRFEVFAGKESNAFPVGKDGLPARKSIIPKSIPDALLALTGGDQIVFNSGTEFEETVWIEENRARKTWVIKTRSGRAIITEGPVGPDRQWGWGRNDAAAKAVEGKDFGGESSKQDKASALNDKYSKSVAEWNRLSTEYKDAKGPQKESIRMEMDSLNREQVAIKAEAYRNAESERRSNSAKIASEKYGAMGIGTKIGIIGHDGNDSIYWEKTGENQWSRRGIGSTTVTITNAEMEGSREIKDAEDLDAMFDDVLEEVTGKPKVTNTPKASVESAFTGEPDPKNSAPMQELGGFAVGDKVSISGRSVSEGVIRQLFTRQSAGGEMRMARVDVAGGKSLDLLTDNLSHQERTAGQAAVSAAKNTGMALGDAIDGLGKLFGGNKFSTGLTFDEKTYAKAKPYFIAAISHLRAAGGDLREAMRAVVKMVVDKFGVDAAENMKPYVVQFISDVRDGKIDDPAATLNSSDTNEATGNDVRKLDTTGQGALEGVSSGEVQGAATGRGTGSGTAEGGRGNGGADGSVAGAGSDRNGGMGNSSERIPVSGTGTGGSGRGRSRSSGGKGRAVSAQLSASNEREPAGGLTADANQPSMALEPGNIDPPQLPEDFIIEDDLGLGEGGQRTKYKNNVEAIRLIRDLEATGRTATTDEQKVLAKYVGWGGIPQAFDPDNKDWSSQYAELKSLLSADEWDAAFESTQYAHYTSREIISGMYAAVRRLGFNGGNVLEAGGGVGNFIGLMPVDLRTNGKVTLVEREAIAAAIAKYLYPRQNIRAEDFTEFGKGQDGQYDMQIGNPPFSSNPLTDKSGRKHLTGLSVHNYFISKGVDMLRDGGIMAVVVSNSFMDASNSRAREYIAKRAKLLGAIRLPNNAFSKNANTQVTTDIIFLQKLPESDWNSKAAIADGKRWVGVTTVSDPQGKGEVALNQYFADNMGMMLGEWGAFGTMYGPDQPALVARPGQDTAAMMARAVAALPEGVYTPSSVLRTKAMEGALLEKLHDNSVGEGGFYVKDGKVWQRVADSVGEAYAAEITPNTVISGTRPIGQSGVDRLRQLAELRRTMRELLAAETEDRKSDMDRLRKELSTRYDAYTADNGRINDPTTKRLMRDDPDYPLIAALEMDYEPGIGPAAAKTAGIKPQTSKAKKAAIFDRRVIEARKAVTKADSPQDAINISMAERGRLDAEYIGRLLDAPADEVLGQLASGAEPLLFRDPATGEYVLRDAYLSGNVREKLKQAKAAGLASNARALEAVQPEDIPASKISVRIGSPWVPVSVYADFASNLFGEGTKTILRYVKSSGGFSGVIIPGSEVMASTKFGTKSYHGDAILLALMNNRQIKVMTKDGDGKPTVDAKATEEANSKADDIKQAFQDWIFKDADRAEVLVRAYNDANNNYVVRKYDGSWLKFPGKVPDAVIRFRRHQRNAIARTIQDRTTLYDHVVGAGKTFTAIASSMEMRRMGLVRKPLMVVPNHLVGQWASDFYRLYPGAKVLAATKKDFERENRRRFLAKIASGDWDAVIIAHSSFERIRPSAEFEQKFIQEEIDRIMREAKAVDESEGDEQQKKRTVKQLAAMQERLENRIAKLREKPMDDLLDFQQIGVDQLFVDEAHCFPAYAKVITDAGVLTIGEIVENRLQLKVLSVDSLTDALEWKQVTDWFKNSVTHFPVRIHHEGGAFECTANHKIWTYEEGFVEAGSLTGQHTICLAPVWASLEAGGEALRDVRNGVQLQVVGEGEQRQEAVLLEPMRGDLAHDAAAHQGRDHPWVTGWAEAGGGAPSREERPEIVGAHDGEQPDAQPGVEGKNGIIAFREDVLISRREQQDHDAAIDAARGDGASNGVLYRNSAGQEYVQVSAELLQSGFGSTGQEDCHRGGWQDAQAETMEAAGCKEDGSSKRARVVCVEVLERGSDGQFAEGFRGDQSVYCLEVEDNHNFFADGVLVSNSFKNLMFTTKMQNIRGLNDPTGSQRAYDMYIKTNQIMEMNGRGQGVVFMTGTPVSNSLAEMYHMMRYLMPIQMRQLGFESFDAWANTYADIKTVFAPKPSGDGFKQQSRFSKFSNVHQLLATSDQVIDTVTMDDIKAAYKEETGKDFPLPRLLTGRRQPVSLEKTPLQEAYMKQIIERLKKLESRKGPPKKGEDNHLSVMSDSRKASMDIRLADKSVIEREENGRVDRASSEIFSRWKKYDAERGTQLVFADLGTPVSTVKREVREYDAIMARITAGEDPETIASAQLGDEAAVAKVNDAEDARSELDAKGDDWLTAIEGAKRGFSVYDDLKKALMEKGVPENQIAFIHSYTTDDQKSGLFRKVNNGEIRILMGSTDKMGAGTNVQKRLVALHHLDVPWKPSDLEQREGRIIRQGNELADKNPDFEVEILAYATKDTLDSFMWDLQGAKLKGINQLRTRDIDNEIPDAFAELEMSAGEMQAAATGNTDMLREIQLRTEVQKMERRQRAFDAGKSDAIAGIRRATREIESLPVQIAAYERLTAASNAVQQDVADARARFKATINGKEYTNHTEAAKVLRDLVDAVETGEDGKERKAKLDVAMNGEQFTNRQKLAEAFARLTGDNEPFVFDAGDGKVYRVDDAADAVMDTIASSRDSEGEKLLGNMGDYKVSIEYSGVIFGGNFEEFDVHASIGDDELPSAVVRTKPGDDRHTAKEILKAVRNMVRDAGSALSSLKQSLEKAKKNLADLSKIDTTSEWPDSERLARMREEHRALRDKINRNDGSLSYDISFFLAEQDSGMIRVVGESGSAFTGQPDAGFASAADAGEWIHRQLIEKIAKDYSGKEFHMKLVRRDSRANGAPEYIATHASQVYEPGGEYYADKDSAVTLLAVGNGFFEAGAFTGKKKPAASVRQLKGERMDPIPDALFSVADNSGPGLTTSRAREILAADPVLSKALPFIELKQATENIPAGAEPIGAEGYYHNGKITLFPDNIKATPTQTAEERLKWVAFHEVTHRGVANLAESREYMAELQQAGKNPFIKNLAKKIHAKRQGTPYEVSMEVAIEEALAEVWAALQTGSSKTIKAQYGLHFPLSIRPRAKSAVARFFEAVKRIYSKVVGRGLTNDQVAELLRKTHEAGMGPDGTNPSGRRNSFAGENSKTADLTALDKAKQRIAAGDNAEAVRKDTGWHTGVDGKWRFEIDDSKAYIKGKGSVLGKPMKSNADIASIIKANRYSPYRASAKLGSILHHPDLFRAYPDLANVDVWVEKKGSGSDGSFEPESGVLTVREDLSGIEAVSVIHHEIQHAIQENEGFASGGSIQAMGRKVAEARAEVDSLSQRLQRIENEAGAEADLWVAKYPDKVKDALDYLRKQGMFDEGDNVRDAVKYAIHDRDPSYQNLTKQWRQAKEAAQQSPTESYRRLAGEVEARNTQSRANLTGAERSATSPKSTEDVAERDQIVKFSKGEISASSSGDQKVRALFRKVQEAQRFGKGVNGVAPELAFDSRYNPGVDLSGAFATAAEHIGDLVHRAAMPLDEYEAGAGIGPGGASYGLSALREKTSRFLGRVKRGEDLDHIPQASRNAEWNFDPENKFKKASFGSVEDGVALFKTAAQRYADAYKQVPVYTELQQLARDAAIALGEFRHDDLLAALEKIDVIVRIDPRSKKASQARAMESYFALLPDVGNDSSDFSADTSDIRYSAPPTDDTSLTRSDFVNIAKEWMFQKWANTLGTQLNTAMLEPLFKPTYDLVQRYLQHTSNDAYDAISAAPNLLGRLEDINDYKRDIKNIANYSQVKADREAAAVPLFEGTRFDKKVYSDAVLKRVYNLTDDQVAVYREARAAIEASLDSHAKSVITKILLDAGAVEFSDIDTLVNRDLPADDYMEELRQRLDADILAANDAIAIQKTALSAAGVTAQDKASIQASIKKGSRRVELLEEAAKRIDSTEDTLSQLKREGYFPLMRWGKYSVTVRDAGGKVVDFRMVDGLVERKFLQYALKKQYQGQGMTVTTGTMDEGRFKDFRGISPETLALFAKEMGVDNDAAYQEYLKLALPGQSAMKRRIHRKGDNGEGIAGFSMDIQRTLAAFVMGNARHSARNIYSSAITKSVDAIPDDDGGVRNTARKLAEFVMEPDENSASVSIRNMLFIWNMGGSVAFAALNLTQPWMMTLPWLSQFSGIGSVVELMGKAAKTASAAQYDGTVPPEYYAEYQRAVREGIVDPQNVFMLQGVERGKTGVGSGIARTLSHGMGMFAAITESYNRKLTLFAALDVAKAKGPQWLKSKGFDSAYAFAKQAIAETQGVYNKGNRPAWARGPLGAIVLVFKQYAINWTEMAVRMGRNHYGDDRMRKGLMMMLGLLFAMAGGLGLPFADDLKDIAETSMGMAGKPVNIERQMQMALGKGMADAVLAGPMNSMVLNSLGLDMHGRMSMGNIAPITGAFNKYTTDDAKLSEGVSVLGAGTGLLKKASDSIAAAQDGRFMDAAQSAAPRSIESLIKGSRMLAEGKARDSRGNVLMETTPAQAVSKMLDFQPASVAITQRERGRRFQDKNIQMVARASLRNRLITAYEEKDAEKIRDAEQALDEWNQDNPLYQIKLKKRDLRRAAKKRGASWLKREETPKGLEWMDEYADQENGQ